MAICLNSYRPLIITAAGREACEKHGLYPFIDGSCRREPDFESDYPSITALCRKGKFAPRLQEGNIVIYISCKDRYDLISDNPNEHHWRFIAILEVIKRFESHQEAADWYRAKGANIPHNCMIKGNGPCSLDKTSPDPRFKTLREWDLSYWERARACPVFLACDKSQYINLNDPPAMTEKTMCEIFGRKRGTQNPPCNITQEQLSKLKRFYSI